MPESKEIIFLQNKEKIVEKFKDGETLLDIEKEFDISRHTIKKYLNKIGVKRSREEINKITQSKREESLLKKYGVINVSQIKDKEMQQRRIEGVKSRRKGAWTGKKNPNYKNKIGNNFGFKSGIREDLGDVFFRSSWEANYARYLSYNNIEWDFEPNHFDLGDGRTYTPDFLLKESGEYIEIKGFWRDDAREKFELFKLQYPEVKIKLIQEEGYKKIIKENKDFIDFE